MDREHSLGEYLKGALAGKLIDSSVRRASCEEQRTARENSSVLRLDAPEVLVVHSRQDLCVHVNNFSSRPARGTLLLRGDETVRGVSYEFDALFELDADDGHCCISFPWRAPAYPTRIKWSASVHFESQMGFSLPECSAATVVVREFSNPVHLS